MKKNILNEINQIKYLFDYRRGRVISEQNNLLFEYCNHDNSPTGDADEDWNNVIAYFTGNTDTNWKWESSTGVAPRTSNQVGSTELYSKNTGDIDCKMTIFDDGTVYKEQCNTKQGYDTDCIYGTWTWDGSKVVLKFAGTSVVNPAQGYIGDTDTEFDVNKVMGLGSNGELVKKLQGWLVNMGYGEPEKVGGSPSCKSTTEYESCDGIYGANTKDAVKQFQEDAEISVDGVFGYESYLAASNLGFT